MARTTRKKKRPNPASSSATLQTPPPPKPSLVESQPKSHKKQGKGKAPAPQKPNPEPVSDSDSDSDSDSVHPPPCSPTSIHRHLEPYTKEQLISLLAGAAVRDSEIVARLLAAADGSESHRKLFVYGLGHDATDEALLAAFSPFGAVSDCNIISDRSTGRCKGYGFVLFASRAAARRALSATAVHVGTRRASVQLASEGPRSSAACHRVRVSNDRRLSVSNDRRVYISNVAPETSLDKLRAFFSQFGDLEGGPFGFDTATGKFRGYSVVVYKNADGAKKALAEPYRMFEGRMLHCQVATDPSQKNKAPMASAVLTSPAAASALPLLDSAALTPQVIAAVAAAQNLALYGQNPAYAALLGNNPLLAAAAFNPALATAALNPAALGAAASSPAAVAALNPAAALAIPRLGMSQGSPPGLPGAYLTPSAAGFSRTGAGAGSSMGGFPGF